MKTGFSFTKYMSFFGPALLVSIGYMDPGNWATAIEGGSRFGYELLWVIVIANAIAIFLQSLATRLGLVTGRHLAQACHDEYPPPVCLVLWLLYEFSLIALDAAMVLGTAIGLNLFLGLPVLPGVFLVAVDALFLMGVLPLMGVRKAELLPVTILGIVLLSFVLNAIFSKPLTSSVVGGMCPRLRNDSLYTALGLLGANIMPHNLYLNSAMVQVQRKAGNLSVGALCFHNLVDIVFILGTALVINVAILIVAASTFHNAGIAVVTLQDGHMLMEQVLSQSVAPSALGLALVCAGLLSTLTGTISGQVAIEGFLGTSVDAWLHRFVIRALSVLPAFACAWAYGNEGVYQLLVFSQVILALQLPFTLIPLIRMTSSKQLMGQYKISGMVEGLAWTVVAFVISLNLWLVFNTLFGATDELGSPAEWEFVSGTDWFSTKIGEAVHSLIVVGVLVAVGLSAGFLLWLVLTPIRAELAESVSVQHHITSAGILLNKEAAIWPIIAETPTAVAAEIPISEDSPLELSNFVELQISLDKNATVVSSEEAEELPAVIEGTITAVVKEKFLLKDDEAPSVEVATVVEETVAVLPASLDLGSEETVDMMSQEELKEVDSQDKICNGHALPVVEAVISCVSAAAVGGLKALDDEADGWENLEQEDLVADVLCGAPCAYEGPESGRSVGGRSDTSEAAGSGSGSGSGSLSRLSGLGRAARRQFAALLDEFWGKLFDLHGQPVAGQTSQGQSVVSRARNNNSHNNHHLPPYQNGYTANSFQQAAKRYSNSLDVYGRAHSHMSASTSAPYGGSGGEYSGSDFGERRYSSMRLSSYHEDYDYQPATIHGYNIASHAARINTGVNNPRMHLNVQPLGGVRGGAGSRSSFSQGASFQNILPYAVTPPSTAYGELGYFPPDRIGYSSNSYLPPQSPKSGDLFSNRGDRHVVPSDSYDGGQWGSTSTTVNSSVEKWNPLVYRATGELDVGRNNSNSNNNSSSSYSSDTSLSSFSHAPIGRGCSSDFSTCSSQPETPLSFDEISPSQTHRDGFSIQAGNSLWSKQPFEQLFGGVTDVTTGFATQQQQQQQQEQSCGGRNGFVSKPVFHLSNGVQFGFELFEHLRVCIGKMLRLDGSDWLFRSDNGCDEDLIAGVAAREKFLFNSEFSEPVNVYTSADYNWQTHRRSSTSNEDVGCGKQLIPGVPHCGDSCVWGSELVVNFGIWCVHRILELSLMESRPELWGKYTYVLNRLQGILEPAFSKPRSVVTPCICLQGYPPVDKRIFRQGSSECYDFYSNSNSNSNSNSSSYPYPWSWGRNVTGSKGKCTSATVFMEMIKEVEIAVGSRKGRTGTAAGDVAFPKGKENLASVLKRYKRRLGTKSTGVGSGSGGGGGGSGGGGGGGGGSFVGTRRIAQVSC